MINKYNISLLSRKIRLMAGAREICIERPGRMGFIKGKPEQLSASKTFNVVANIQPVGGNELLQVPEGDRRSHHQYLYTRDEILINDIAIIDNQHYETQEVEIWGPYFRARVVLKDVNQRGLGGDKLSSRRFNQ